MFEAGDLAGLEAAIRQGLAARAHDVKGGHREQRSMNLKKAALGAFERALGAKVVRPNRVGRIFETVHLARFFDRFEIDCVFDVGANFGQYAEMIRGLGYRGDIVSFEPIPEAASALRAKAQADPRWHIEEKALDETIRQVAFNIMSSSQFSSLKLPSAADTAHFSDVNVPSRQITVTTATLSTPSTPGRPSSASAAPS